MVVVNDGSADATEAIARDFGDRLPRLQVITVDNGGVSRARNLAIAASSGEIIAPLDSDDVWHPTYLAKMAGALAASPGCAFVYCFFRRLDGDGLVRSDGAAYPLDGWGFYQMLVHNYVANGSSMVFRRDRCLAVGGYNSRMDSCEDLLLQLHLAWEAPVRCVPEYLVGYRIVEGSLSRTWVEHARVRVQSMELLPEFIADIHRRPLRVAKAEAHNYLATRLRLEGVNTPERRRHWRAALWLNPIGTAARTWGIGRRSQKRSPARGQPFAEIDPALPGVFGHYWLTRLECRWAATLDRIHGEAQAKA